MLVVTREKGQTLIIGENTQVMIVKVRGNKRPEKCLDLRGALHPLDLLVLRKENLCRKSELPCGEESGNKRAP